MSWPVISNTWTLTIEGLASATVRTLSVNPILRLLGTPDTAIIAFFPLDEVFGEDELERDFAELLLAFTLELERDFVELLLGFTLELELGFAELLLGTTLELDGGTTELLLTTTLELLSGSPHCNS